MIADGSGWQIRRNYRGYCETGAWRNERVRTLCPFWILVFHMRDAYSNIFSVFVLLTKDDTADVERMITNVCCSYMSRMTSYTAESSSIQLKSFEITADGCSMDKAYEILNMQIVHNGFKAFYNGWQQYHFFLYLISLILFVSFGQVGF